MTCPELADDSPVLGLIPTETVTRTPVVDVSLSVFLVTEIPLVLMSDFLDQSGQPSIFSFVSCEHRVSVSQSVSQTVCQCFNLSHCQSASQSVDRSVDQSIRPSQ